MTTSKASQDDYFKRIWVTSVPQKVIMHAWRLGHDRLPTLYNLYKIGIFIANVSMCSCCQQQVETATHLFFECLYYSKIWSARFNWFGFSTTMHIFVIISLNNLLDCQTAIWKIETVGTVVWFAVIWAICLTRNDHIFNNIDTDLEHTKEKVKIHSWMWILAKQPNFSYPLSS